MMTRISKAILDVKSKVKIAAANRTSNPQSGATMVALLALMTMVALALLAAAPSVLLEVQREKEVESIRRGEEIAEAIRLYAKFTGRLPQKMEDLTEGVQIPGRTKKFMILRESAIRDPLASTGEWKIVQSNELKTIQEFQRKLVTYTGSNAISNPEPKQVFEQISINAISQILDVETTEDKEPPGGEDTADNVEGAFIAVRSRSQRKSVLNYYGIERHDRWLFTPLFRGTGGKFDPNGAGGQGQGRGGGTGNGTDDGIPQ